MNNPIKKHGGARPGARRPAGVPAKLPDMPATSDPLEYLQQVMSDPANDARLCIGSAVALLPYVHAKVGETGKNDGKRDAAKKAGVGRYASGKPPVRLVT